MSASHQAYPATHNSTVGHGYPNSATGPHNSHITTSSTTGGGLASKIPGTDAYKAAHSTPTATAGYGASAGPSYASVQSHGAGGTMTSATGVPGTNAHAATHGTNHHSTHASRVAGSSGLQPGAPGTWTTTTTTTVPKASVEDKLSGKVDVAVGKLTNNPTKVAEGNVKQAQGKVGVEQAGLSSTHTAGTHGTGRY